LLDLYAICYNYSRINIFDWTLSASDHITLIHSSWSQSHSLLYSLESDLTENTFIAWHWMSCIVAYSLERVYLGTGCLPRICLRGRVFIEPLPSSGSVRHSIIPLNCHPSRGQSTRPGRSQVSLPEIVNYKIDYKSLFMLLFLRPLSNSLYRLILVDCSSSMSLTVRIEPHIHTLNFHRNFGLSSVLFSCKEFERTKSVSE
jgi:hypothetical protein